MSAEREREREGRLLEFMSAKKEGRTALSLTKPDQWLNVCSYA
jgi:hypothetical protein